MNRWCAWLVLGGVAFVGCEAPGPAQGDREGRTFVLREVQRYGAPDLTDGADLTEAQRGAGADVLGGVAGVVVDDSARRLVLDQRWHKIVVFGRDGSFRDVLLGGRGEGPGEFRLPVHMTGLPEGGVSVLDYEAGRVTWFVGGEVGALIPIGLANSLRHLVIGDTVWVTRGAGGGSARPSAYLFDSRGDSIGTLPPLEVQDQPYGVPIGMAKDEAGRVLLSTSRPGVWMEYHAGEWTRKGEVRFPEVGPPVREQVAENQIRVTPSRASVAGIAVMGDSLVLQGYMMYDRPFDWEAESRPEISRFLGVYGRDGQHLYDLPLAPGLDTRYLYVDPFERHVFLTRFEPFPQVVEFEMDVCVDCG